jgi:RNA polymerase sigma-32 factor
MARKHRPADEEHREREVAPAGEPDEAAALEEPERDEEPAGPSDYELKELDGSASDALPPPDEQEPAPGDGESHAEHDPGVALAPVERSLAPYDPLTRYIQEVRRYRVLTREEEHALAVRYTETGDVEAARALITANLRLVIKIAHEYRQAHRNLLDLVQEGNIGLMQAVKKYDPYRGVKLSSYAAWWIRAYILKYILNNWRLVKIGTTQAQRHLFFNLRKEKERLEKEGFVPEAKLLAQRLDVSEKEVVEMERRLGAGDLSLDAPLSREDEGGRSHLDLLESSGETRPDVAAEADEFRALLRQKLEAFEKTLVGREKTIFHERLHSDTPATLQEIGERYNVSRERARQLEKRLANKLRAYLREELGEAVQIAMGIEE